MTNVSSVLVPGIDGNPRVRFIAQYDFPNSYCQFWDAGGSCGWSVWPIPGFDYQTALDLRFNGQSVLSPFSSPPIPAIYESGLWMPTQNAGCGGAVRTYTVRAVNQCWGNVDVNVVVTDPAADSGMCSKPDRGSCPAGPGAPPSLGVGEPVNVGSGNVHVTADLLSVDGNPQSMHFALDYHSGRPLYPSLVTTPLSSGWTHRYNETLRAVDPFGVLLYRIAPKGFEELYELGPDGLWHAISPADLRGTIAKSGAQYQLRDLDGTITAFDVATGRWLSTTDRWGNAVTGGYTGGALTAVTDSMGRSATLGYTGGSWTSLTIGGNAWRFEYGGGNLTKIFDPPHPGATPWRSMDYDVDRNGVMRLLTEVRDEADMLLERRHRTLDLAGAVTTEEDQLCDTPASPCAAWTTRRTQTNVYDARHRLSEVRHPVPAGAKVVYTHDEDGNLAGVRDENHTAANTIYTYDALHRLETVTQKQVNTPGPDVVTAYAYDAHDNLTRVTDPNGTRRIISSTTSGGCRSRSVRSPERPRMFTIRQAI